MNATVDFLVDSIRIEHRVALYAGFLNLQLASADGSDGYDLYTYMRTICLNNPAPGLDIYIDSFTIDQGGVNRTIRVCPRQST